MSAHGVDNQDDTRSQGSQDDLLPKQAMAQSCLVIIKQRRRDAITTVQVILGILKALPENSSIAAFMCYVEQLVEVKHDQAIMLI